MTQSSPIVSAPCASAALISCDGSPTAAKGKIRARNLEQLQGRGQPQDLGQEVLQQQRDAGRSKSVE